MKMHIIGCAAIFLSGVVALRTEATPRTYYITGKVVIPDLLFGSLVAGQSFGGSFSFDDDALTNPDRRPQAFVSDLGYYDRAGFDIAGHTLSRASDVVNDANLYVVSDNSSSPSGVFDGVVIVGRYLGTEYCADFMDSTHTILTSDQLAPIGGSLASYSYTSMNISNAPFVGGSPILATITQLSSQPIPEPGALFWVAGVGLFFSRNRRRRSGAGNETGTKPVATPFPSASTPPHQFA